jgi:hypothetical protein
MNIYRETPLGNPPKSPFFKGGLESVVFLPPSEKGGWGDFPWLREKESGPMGL